MARIPEAIDKYKLEELVAAGGMGKVYRGIHPTLERSVIIKKLSLRGDAAYAQRFRREASILMDFRSDYVVDVYDHFRKASNHYIVMEYVDGLSAQDLLRRERYLDGPMCAYIALCTAKALAYAHRKKVIHRDIKPANVLISREGDVKLADFGIATSREGESDITSEGMTLGTPSYMAPEQFTDSRSVDGRADFYSLGVMLYELLTGRKPYPGRFGPELIRTVESGKYKRARAVNPAVAPELERLVSLVVRPNPRRRCGPDEIIRRLDRYLARFDRNAVRERLAALVGGERRMVLRRVRDRGKVWRRVALAAGLVAAGAVAGWSVVTGLHLRLFAPERYRQVRFVAEGFPGEVSAADLHAKLLPASEPYNGEGGLPVTFLPILPRFTGDPQSVIVTAAPKVLPAGEYRALVTVADREVVTLFALDPWSEAGEERIVHVPIVDSEPRPLRITAAVADAVDGSDLTSRSTVEILRGNSFVPLARAGQVVSGRVHTVRVRVPGYEAQTLVVEPRRETGSVTIGVRLDRNGG